MVLTQPHSILDGDASPLVLMRQRRSEADAQLLKSLMNASFMALTLVVAFMVGQIVLRGEEHETLAPTLPAGPPLVPPNVFRIYVPYSPQVQVPVTTKAGDVLPVDDQTPESTDPVVEPAHPDATSREPGVLAGATSGTGTVGVPAPADPKWGEYVYFEEAPELVTPVQPVYPGIAAQAGMEASVSVRMLVGVDGRVKRAEIQRSAPMFDEAALTAARQWIFTPAKSNGHPVAVWVLLPVEFKLR